MEESDGVWVWELQDFFKCCAINKYPYAVMIWKKRCCIFYSDCIVSGSKEVSRFGSKPWTRNMLIAVLTKTTKATPRTTLQRKRRRARLNMKKRHGTKNDSNKRNKKKKKKKKN